MKSLVPPIVFSVVAMSLTTQWIHSAVFGDDFGWPGPPPGPMRIAITPNLILVSNTALSLSWTLRPDGFRPGRVRDEQTGQTLSPTNEAFQILLTDGRRYPASSFNLPRDPVITELRPDPNASRLAGRIAGRQIELPLVSKDGRLRVTWRAIGHDEANYVRQELDLTAAKEDVSIREIVWWDEPLPGAATRGRVDGSPVVAGDFFLASDDPMALNGVTRSNRTMGHWTAADLVVNRRVFKTWPVEAECLRGGTNEITFRYERGPHRLDVWRVALRENGTEVSHDEHHGRTGVEHVDNTYSLVLPELKPGARYELTALLGSDPDFKFPATGRVDSSGRVEIAGADGTVRCRLPRRATLRRGETLTPSFVLGAAPPGQMRRAFLYYLERERAHPYRPFLHYNSWYDIAWAPFALNETNCLEAIRLFGDRLIQPHGVVMDAMVFDDGWDNPKTLWQFHGGFPNGFRPLADLCRQYGTRLGVWLSPFGGYGESRNQRLKFGSTQGFETNATGFSLAGPKYYAAFKNSCVNMIRRFGVNHFKFDGIATGMYASGGAEYIRDTEAMRRLMLELRREDPNLYINLTTGSWPSPFWLRYADSVWRQGGDMGLAGKGGKQQQWLTYRDQETYRNVVRKGPLYPLNSLMTQGVAYSRHGLAGDPTFTSAGFKDDVRAFFGSGTGLQELYLQPGKLTDGDWKVLAEAAKWSRANADVLVDTHWIGGDPSKLEVYGYASWTPRQGIVMLRNPDDQSHEFVLDVGAAFELPPGAPTAYSLKSPWAEEAGKSALTAEAGKPLRLTLKPFEIVVFEATPVR